MLLLDGRIDQDFLDLEEMRAQVPVTNAFTPNKASFRGFNRAILRFREGNLD